MDYDDMARFLSVHGIFTRENLGIIQTGTVCALYEHNKPQPVGLIQRIG
jgi:hypothetical protein